MNKTIFNEYIDQGYNHIPVFREVVLDTDTALGLYLKLANNTYSYLFESVQGGEKWGRYSIIGLHAQTVIKVFDYEIQIEKDSNIIERFQVEDPLAWIEQYQQQFKVPEITDLPEFNGGLVGYFGYEIIRYIEPKLKDIQLKDELNIADILLMVSNDLVVFDNLANKAFLLTHVNPETQSYDQAMAYLDTIEADIDRPLVKQDYQSDNLTTQDFSSSFGEQNYKDVVEHIQRYIVAGDVMQVVPSQRLSAPYKAPSVELYRQLRRLNPSPYMYYLNLGDVDIIGSSPDALP